MKIIGIRMKIAVLALAALAAPAMAADCYSTGVRVGVVQKFSQKGHINKSWEGQMVQAGQRVKATERGAAATDVWSFSTLDVGVAKKLDDAVFTGETVAVRYCQKRGFELMGQTDTSYLITDVRVRQ